MKIVVVNAGPRKGFNTDALLTEAARGAAAQGAEIVRFDLYQLEKHTGCISCFGCKRGDNRGYCVVKDGLYPVLQAIREADALIVGSPNYLGNVTAEFRAFYERLVFQNITYNAETRRYHDADTPVLFLMTSNCPEEIYDANGYTQMINGYVSTLSAMVGPAQYMVAGDTYQVPDYSIYDWTNFDPEKKKQRHDTIFPLECRKAYEMGQELARSCKG